MALVAGETATPAQVEALRKQLGYDRPLPVQFVDYVWRLVRGDMGTSIFTRRPIVEDLLTAPSGIVEGYEASTGIAIDVHSRIR